MNGPFRDHILNQVAEMFGGPLALANRLGVGRTALYNWDTRGLPARQKLRIIELAEEDGLELPRGFTKSLHQNRQTDCHNV